MAHNHPLTRISLNQKMIAIGLRLSISEPELQLESLKLLTLADLEETLVEASYEALTDWRVLSLLTSWITVHAEYVIVEKLEKKRREYEKHNGTNRVLDLLAAQAVATGNHKFQRLIRVSFSKPEVAIHADEILSSIEFQGPNKVLAEFGIIVPKNLLRIRESDVLTAVELGKWNTQYRNRLIFGASWRADLMSAIEAGVPNPNRAAQLLGCSYEPAYRVYKDYRAAHGLVA